MRRPWTSYHRSLVFRQKKIWIKCEECAGALSFHHFLYNENPTRALNTTSLKCWLTSTDVIDRRKKIYACVWRFDSSHATALHWNSPGFRKKISSNTNRVVLVHHLPYYYLSWKPLTCFKSSWSCFDINDRWNISCCFHFGFAEWLITSLCTLQKLSVQCVPFFMLDDVCEVLILKREEEMKLLALAMGCLRRSGRASRSHHH